MRMRTLLVPPAIVALAAAAVPALAAEPSEGTVSKANPKVEWTGTSNAYGVYPIHGIAQAGEPCAAPACDSFTLEVADQDTLTLTADNDATGGPGSDSVEMDVVTPSGETIYTQSAADAPVVVKIKNAAKGSYTVNVLVNQPANVSGTFKASAVLGAVTKPAAPLPEAPPTNVDAPAPAPAAEPAASLSLATKSASAKKSKKKLTLKVGASKTVTDVTASLKKGSKTLGTAKLASLGTSGKLVFKLKKKLKKGAYTVLISAKDGDRAVGLKSKLTVKK